MATRTPLLILAAAALLFTAAEASARSAWIPPRHQGVDVTMMCGGSACETLNHRGTRYVVGTMGQRYGIALSNRNNHWVEVVVSVDGRNIVDGDRSGSAGRGYLLAPYASVQVDGWRTSASQVAAFRFTSVSDSYAGRMGTRHDAGTIRVQVFRERGSSHVIPHPYLDRDLHEHAPAPTQKRHSGASGSAEAHDRAHRRITPRDRQHLGTKYGETRWQPVDERHFTRANPHRPDQTLTLRYDSRAGLIQRGVIRRPTPRHWNDHGHYVPPPPTW